MDLQQEQTPTVVTPGEDAASAPVSSISKQQKSSKQKGSECPSSSSSSTLSPAPSSVPSKVRFPARPRWLRMFHQLEQFSAENGHCLVPNRYPQNPSLACWVSVQRRQYKYFMSGDTKQAHNFTTEKIRALESIGFTWRTRDPNHIPWEERFQELVEYKKVHGDCVVPMGFKENTSLGNWVSTQRQEYKFLQDGRSSRLTSQRIEMLNSIGFVWEAPRGAKKKERKKRKLLESDQQLDNASPPSSDKGKGCNHVNEPVVHTTAESNKALSTSSNSSSMPSDKGSQCEDCEDDNIAPLHSCQDSSLSATTASTATVSSTDKSEGHAIAVKPSTQLTDAASLLSSLKEGFN